MQVVYPHFSPPSKGHGIHATLDAARRVCPLGGRGRDLLHWGLHVNRGHGSISCEVMLKTAPV